MLAKFPIFRTLAFSALAACTATPHDPAAARDLAKRAYIALESRPYDRDSVAFADQSLAKAKRLAPEEVWVHIGLAHLALVRGHDGGSWYAGKMFDPNALGIAREEASKAVVDDPKEAMAWCMQGWVDILDKDFPRVQADVNQAYLLDTSLFEPYFLRAAALLGNRQYEKAKGFYLLADSHAVRPKQKANAHRGLSSVAYGQHDRAEELRQLLLQAAVEPDNGWGQSLVGEWYSREKRWPEAVEWWERTVALAPFPRAVEQLRKAREALRTGASPAP